MALAVFADRSIAGRGVYRTLLIWPYAIAPAMSAVLFLFVLNPRIGLLGRWLNRHGIAWDYTLNGCQAMLMVVSASAWKQVSYNFIFFLAGLQSIPRAVTEAARMDGAKGWHRFRTITFPLLAPTTFFLLVVNVVYAAFDTFGTIYALTQGGPGKDTETLVVKVFRDGVINQDIGSSSAQSVVLMAGGDRDHRRAVPLHGPKDGIMRRPPRLLAHAVLDPRGDAVRPAGLAGVRRLHPGLRRHHARRTFAGAGSVQPVDLCTRV